MALCQKGEDFENPESSIIRQPSLVLGAKLLVIIEMFRGSILRKNATNETPNKQHNPKVLLYRGSPGYKKRREPET